MRRILLVGRRFVRLSAATALLLAAPACDLGGPAPSAECSESGAQCLLADGPLGVCERARCPDGTAPPCFECVPQH